MTIALLDTFTGSDGTALTSHTMDTGPGWTAVSGTFKLAGNKATTNSGANDDKTVSDSGQADITLTCDSVSYYSSSNMCASVIFRYTNSANFFLLDMEPQINKLALYENVNNTYLSRVNVTISKATGVLAALSVVTSGNSITCKMDGANTLTYSSANNATSTKHGLRLSANGSTTTPTWDNFLVTYGSPPSQTPTPWWYFRAQGGLNV